MVVLTDTSNIHPKYSPRPLPSDAPTPQAPPQQRRHDGQGQGAHVPFNTLQRVPFETELFQGEIVLSLAGLAPPPPVCAGACVHVLMCLICSVLAQQWVRVYLYIWRVLRKDCVM